MWALNSGRPWLGCEECGLAPYKIFTSVRCVSLCFFHKTKSDATKLRLCIMNDVTVCTEVTAASRHAISFDFFLTSLRHVARIRLTCDVNHKTFTKVSWVIIKFPFRSLS